jgi:GAF domain-containing protein
MPEEPPAGEQSELAKAQETIARQVEEMERLRRRLNQDRFAEELREALIMAATAGTISSPVSHSRLLEMIVETAAHVIRAQAASLFLIDETTNELTFEVALGQKADEARKFRVPLGKGVAGLVAVTGQPMAVADDQQDAPIARDIATQIGYIPHSLLCVPLFYHDRTIGVLELLDKEGASSFSQDDMDALGLFANQAAVAIEQSRTHQNLGVLVGEVIQSLSGVPAEEKTHLARRGEAFAEYVEEDPTYLQSMELARLVQAIAWQGEQEFKACHSILLSFAEYLRSRGGGSAHGGIR